MSRNTATLEFRCPTCGAEAALRLSADAFPTYVTLKCLSCAALVRVPPTKPGFPESPGPDEAGPAN
jgi:transcription elongation factor Elf1